MSSASGRTMWDRLQHGEEPPRIGTFNKDGSLGPLTAGHLREIVRALNRLDYADSCPVQISTPLPPRDRRAVGITVSDFTPQKGDH